MNRDGNMNIVLRRIAFVMGVILLAISIYWSQDGFNFSAAGSSGGTDLAITIGYTIAIAVTVVQFVFSTNIRELNPSLIVFGLIAYIYSIYTNYQGIIHFQGTQPNSTMAWVLGFAMDGVPEPLIAWGLKESLSGDFVGNLFKGFGSFMTGKPLGNGQQQHPNNNQQHRQEDKQKGTDRRAQLERQFHNSNNSKPTPAQASRPLHDEPTYHPVGMSSKDSNRPNRFHLQ